MEKFQEVTMSQSPQTGQVYFNHRIRVRYAYGD